MAADLLEGGAEKLLTEMTDAELIRFVSLDVTRAICERNRHAYVEDAFQGERLWHDMAIGTDMDMGMAVGRRTFPSPSGAARR